jgi:glycosyltransferase involved in cell wall biosynthesis
MAYHSGLERTLLALAELAETGAVFEADVVGDGPLLRYLRWTAEDVGLDGRVRFHGACPLAATQDLIRRADVFVSSDVHGEVSAIALEAKASGVPIVSTCGDLVTDGYDGHLVPSGDVHALADRIGRLVLHPDERREMGRRGQGAIEAGHQRARQVRELEALYARAGGTR